MDFSLTEEQQLVQETAARFSKQQLAPDAALFDRGEKKDSFLQNLKALAQLGFMGLNINCKFGGSEAGSISFSLAITELARECASTAVTVSVSNMVAEVIQSVGTDAQRNE